MSARGRTWAGSIAGASSRLSTQAYLLAVVASILILGLMFIQFELEPVPVRRRPSTGDSVTSSNGTYWVENAKGVLEERLVDPWPTIFYLGVPKAGSTSLFFFLQKHPHVCAGHQHDDPQLVNKEVDFFIKPDLFVQGPPLYLSAFDRSAKCLELARAGIRGSFLDASTKYLLDTGAAQRLKQTIPPELHGKLRFVVVLREPVERDRSWQGQKARTAGKSMSDAEYLHSVHVRTQAPAQVFALIYACSSAVNAGASANYGRTAGICSGCHHTLAAAVLGPIPIVMLLTVLRAKNCGNCESTDGGDGEIGDGTG